MNHEQANRTAHRSCSCYVIIFYCCSGPVLLAGEKKKKNQAKFYSFNGKHSINLVVVNAKAGKKRRWGRSLPPSGAQTQRGVSCTYLQPRNFHLLKGQMCLVLLLCNHKLTFACSCSELCTLSWAAICFYAYFILTAIVDLAVWKNKVKLP